MSILDKFSLSGKLALVTGCKRGIGRAVAEAFAEAGADIVGTRAAPQIIDALDTMREIGIVPQYAGK